MWRLRHLLELDVECTVEVGHRLLGACHVRRLHVVHRLGAGPTENGLLGGLLLGPQLHFLDQQAADLPALQLASALNVVLGLLSSGEVGGRDRSSRRTLLSLTRGLGGGALCRLKRQDRVVLLKGGGIHHQRGALFRPLSVIAHPHYAW